VPSAKPAFWGDPRHFFPQYLPTFAEISVETGYVEVVATLQHWKGKEVKYEACMEDELHLKGEGLS